MGRGERKKEDTKLIYHVKFCVEIYPAFSIHSSTAMSTEHISSVSFQTRSKGSPNRYCVIEIRLN